MYTPLLPVSVYGGRNPIHFWFCSDDFVPLYVSSTTRGNVSEVWMWKTVIVRYKNVALRGKMQFLPRLKFSTLFYVKKTSFELRETLSCVNRHCVLRSRTGACNLPLAESEIVSFASTPNQCKVSDLANKKCGKKIRVDLSEVHSTTYRKGRP
jgi:hypothetical protein